MNRWTSLLLLFLSQSAFAGLGVALPSYDLPPYVCAINIYDGSGQLKDDCSGTLISDKQILTAAHCIDARAEYNYRVWCPGQGKQGLPSPLTGIAVISVERHPGYNRREIADPEGKGTLTDLALLNLAASPGPRVAALLENTEELSLLIQRSEKCGLFGFGGTRSEERQFGYLRGTIVPPASLELRGRTIISHIMRANGSGITMPGDSGGSLSCEDSEGRWVHVGVVSGARLYPYDQYYASVADDNPFFAGKRQRFSTGEFSDCQPTRWCQAAEMFSEDYDEYQTLAVGWERGSLAYLDRLRKDLDSFESAVQTGAPGKSLEKALQSLERKFERIRVITVQQGFGHVFYVEPYSVLTFDVSSRDLVQLDEPEKLGAFFGSLQESRGIKSTAELAPAPRFIPKQIEGEMVTGTLIVKRGSSQIFLCEGIVLCRSGAFKDVQIKASSLAATADLLNTRPVYLDVKF